MNKISILNASLISEIAGGQAPNGKVTRAKVFEVDSLSDVSDGYHTISELYEQRHVLFIALCRLESYWFKTGHTNIAEIPGLNPVWRSKKHSDGTSWDGWFILGIGREQGKQRTFHLPMSKWEITNFAETLDKAPEFDGHTSKDVISRLEQL